jgi:amino acid adenylation domain-containing protein
VAGDETDHRHPRRSKAGKIYVPLDLALPAQRILSILEDCQAHCVITDGAGQAVAHSLWDTSGKVICIDELDGRISGTNLDLAISPDELAFILYTSGTTGTPKGVVQNHRNILHAIRAYTNDIHISPDDRLTLLFSLSFHGSVRGLFGALLNGASAHRFDPKMESIQDLIAWLMAQEITIYHSTATLFRNLAPMLSGSEHFAQLRIVQLAAESVVYRDLELFKRFFPSSCIFANRLGTTETGTYLRFQVDANTPLTGQSVPVGYPVDGMHVFLLNDAGKKIGCNETGEIAVKSRYLSPGYWRNPKLTKAKFVLDPNGGDERTYLTGDIGRMDVDGCFFHLGRKDFQVKIRGFQVAVGEVEALLLNHSSIKEVAIVSPETRSGDTRLIAYFVAAKKPAPNSSELRRFLKEKLPDYMIPSAFILLDRMPLTPNGKIDRQALPALNNVRPELETPYVAPRTLAEERLTDI